MNGGLGYSTRILPDDKPPLELTVFGKERPAFLALANILFGVTPDQQHVANKGGPLQFCEDLLEYLYSSSTAKTDSRYFETQSYRFYVPLVEVLRFPSFSTLLQSDRYDIIRRRFNTDLFEDGWRRAGIFAVSATERFEEEVIPHIMDDLHVARAYGVTSLIVCVMETEGIADVYERLEEICEQMEPAFLKAQFPLECIQFVPFVPRECDDEFNEAFYHDVYEALDRIQDRPTDDIPRLLINRNYQYHVKGRVISGTIKTGEALKFSTKDNARRYVESFKFLVNDSDMKDIPEIEEGYASYEIELGGKNLDKVDVGDVGYYPDRFLGEVITFDSTIIGYNGCDIAFEDTVKVHLNGLVVKCDVASAPIDLPELGHRGQACNVVLRPQKRMQMAAYDDCQAIGRFYIQDADRKGTLFGLGFVNEVTRLEELDPLQSKTLVALHMNQMSRCDQNLIGMVFDFFPPSGVTIRLK